MPSPVALQLLVGLLCLNEFFRPEVTSAAAKPKSCLCRQLSHVSQGQMVITDPYEKNNEPKLYCGQKSGRFLAVGKNELFHLSCAGATPITQAKGMLFESTDQGAKDILFAEDETCWIYPGNIKTGDNAKKIANKLWDIYVPYDCENCNMKHYLDYLSQGKTTGAKETCPVFKTFTSKTRIDFQEFRMAGKKMEYNWPPHYGGSLTAIARAPSRRKSSPSSSRAPNTTRQNSPRSQGFLSAYGRWIVRSLSNTSGKNKKMGVVEKRHGTHGGGTTTGGTTAGYPYANQAGQESAAANRRSAATGIKPLWGAQFPDWSGYWGYGANTGAQQWGASTGYIQ